MSAMESIQVIARVPTGNGAKYVQQLSKHWAHKLPVDLKADVDPVTAVVTFPIGVATMTAQQDALVLAITGDDREKVDGLKDVVANHLDRFAFREAPLAYNWAWG